MICITTWCLEMMRFLKNLMQLAQSAQQVYLILEQQLGCTEQDFWHVAAGSFPTIEDVASQN